MMIKRSADSFHYKTVVLPMILIMNTILKCYRKNKGQRSQDLVVKSCIMFHVLSDGHIKQQRSKTGKQRRKQLWWWWHDHHQQFQALKSSQQNSPKNGKRVRQPKGEKNRQVLLCRSKSKELIRGFDLNVSNITIFSITNSTFFAPPQNSSMLLRSGTIGKELHKMNAHLNF